jgi:hypothetical protein
MALAITVAVPSARGAAAYYVAIDGQDANSGTLEKPFRTIQKAGTVATAGDTVYIRAGTYRETVVPAHSGTANAPITFRPYQHEAVTVSGADPVPTAAWELHRGKIYRAKMGWDLRDMNQVFVDGHMMTEACWPATNQDLLRPTTAKAGKGTGHKVTGKATGSGTITHPQLTQPGGYWTGCTIHVCLGPVWVQTSHKVTASAPGRLTFTFPYDRNDPTFVPAEGNPFWLSGKLDLLTQAGQWFHDPKSGNLCLWLPTGASPSRHLIEAKKREYAFDLSNRQYITLAGIKLFAATIATDARSAHIELDGVNARYVSHYTDLADYYTPGLETSGIMLKGNNNVLRNSVIAYSAGNGVLVMGGNNKIVNNIIHDVNYMATDCAAIGTGNSVKSANVEIANNTIYNAARSGIQHRFAVGGNFHHNHIYQVALRAVDCGGTYTWGEDGKGLLIAYNVIHDVMTGTAPCGGIYLDDNSRNYRVHHNVVWGAWNAFLWNPGELGSGLELYHNTFIATDNSFNSSPPTKQGRVAIIENNIFTHHVEVAADRVLMRNNLMSGRDPRFVDGARHNYQLQRGSPAIAAGVTTPVQPGRTPDLGAYEHGKPAWKAGATITEAHPVPGNR